MASEDLTISGQTLPELNELAVVGAPGVAGAPYDLGAGAVTGQRPLAGAFRVPTLRNLARTAPYFQAGKLATLEDVVDFYNRPRGQAVPPVSRWSCTGTCTCSAPN